MSKDDLHNIASADTPEAVQVPNTWPGLVMWAAGRFGTGIVIAVAVMVGLSWFVSRIYTDQSATNTAVLVLVREQSQANQALAVSAQATATAITELSRQVEKNTSAVEEAHRRASLR